MNSFQVTMDKDALNGPLKDGSWNHRSWPQPRSAGLSWSCSTSELRILEETRNMIVAPDGTRVIETVNKSVITTSRTVIEHKTAYVPLGSLPGEQSTLHQRQVGRLYLNSVTPSSPLPVNVPAVRSGQVVRSAEGERRIVDDQNYRRVFVTDRVHPEIFGYEPPPRRTVRHMLEDQFRIESHMQLAPANPPAEWDGSLNEGAPTYATATQDDIPFQPDHNLELFGHEVIRGPESSEVKMEGRRVIPRSGLGNVMVCATELCMRCKARGTSWRCSMCGLSICDDCTRIENIGEEDAQYRCVMPDCTTPSKTNEGAECKAPVVTLLQYEQDKVQHALVIREGDSMVTLRSWSSEDSLTHRGIHREHLSPLR